jgi:hypothetical protein
MDNSMVISILNLLVPVGNMIIVNAPNLVGLLLPPLVDFLNKDIPDEKDRYFVTLIICAVVAALINWNKLFFGDPTSFYTSLTLIFIESQTVFKLYFKDSYLRQKLQETLIGSPVLTPTPVVEVKPPEEVLEKTDQVSEAIIKQE